MLGSPRVKDNKHNKAKDNWWLMNLNNYDFTLLVVTASSQKSIQQPETSKIEILSMLYCTRVIGPPK